MPFHWYFANAIPRSTTVAIPFIIIGQFYKAKGRYIDYDILKIISPGILFVLLYSLLPHKELRFIFPALTLLNIGAAFGLSKM
jgi:alpha-1,6-mannosyltransferase